MSAKPCDKYSTCRKDQLAKLQAALSPAMPDAKHHLQPWNPAASSCKPGPWNRARAAQRASMRVYSPYKYNPSERMFWVRYGLLRRFEGHTEIVPRLHRARARKTPQVGTNYRGDLSGSKSGIFITNFSPKAYTCHQCYGYCKSQHIHFGLVLCIVFCIVFCI